MNVKIILSNFMIFKIFIYLKYYIFLFSSDNLNFDDYTIKNLKISINSQKLNFRLSELG